MLSHIARLIRDFELEHGMHPNLLYLNHVHHEHLKSAFDERFNMGQIMQMLNMEMVIDAEIMHPHVAWTEAAHRVAS